MTHTIRHFRTQVPPIAQVVPGINGELKLMFLNRYKILADYLITALVIEFHLTEQGFYTVFVTVYSRSSYIYTGMVQSRAFCLHSTYVEINRHSCRIDLSACSVMQLNPFRICNIVFQYCLQ